MSLTTQDELKAELRRLLTERDVIEAEIAEKSARLNAPGQPGTTEPLVDKEGFPRSDIDVASVRADRHRLAVLHTDHKALTATLEGLMHRLHALAREAGDAGPANGAAAAPSAKPPPVVAPAAPAALPLEPFALVDDVADGSPAQAAGLLVNDRLIAFGTVTRRSAVRGLQSVAAEVGANEEREVQVAVLRGGAVVEMTVTPRKWSGNGLLGAHMVPL